MTDLEKIALETIANSLVDCEDTCTENEKTDWFTENAETKTELKRTKLVNWIAAILDTACDDDEMFSITPEQRPAVVEQLVKYPESKAILNEEFQYLKEVVLEDFDL